MLHNVYGEVYGRLEYNEPGVCRAVAAGECAERDAGGEYESVTRPSGALKGQDKR